MQKEKRNLERKYIPISIYHGFGWYLLHISNFKKTQATPIPAAISLRNLKLLGHHNLWRESSLLSPQNTSEGKYKS